MQYSTLIWMYCRLSRYLHSTRHWGWYSPMYIPASSSHQVSNPIYTMLVSPHPLSHPWNLLSMSWKRKKWSRLDPCLSFQWLAIINPSIPAPYFCSPWQRTCGIILGHTRRGQDATPPLWAIQGSAWNPRGRAAGARWCKLYYWYWILHLCNFFFWFFLPLNMCRCSVRAEG